MSAVDTLVGFTSAAGFLALAYGPWQATCTDIARQYCFAKRDQLFDLARAGRIDFRSNEYRAMRSSIEKTIRFSHELSFHRLVLLGFDRTYAPDSTHLSTLSKAASRADPAVRGDLERLALDVEEFMMLIVLLRSPLLWLLTPVAIVLVIAALLFGAVRRALIDLLRAMGERAQIQAEGA